MKYYQVAVPFIQLAGTLHLTDAQAQARAHFLTRLDAKVHGENRFTTQEAVGFKKGEVLGYDGALPKALAGALAPKDIDFERRVKADRAAVSAVREKQRREREARAAEAKRRRAEVEAKQKARLEQTRREAAERHGSRQGRLGA